MLCDHSIHSFRKNNAYCYSIWQEESSRPSEFIELEQEEAAEDEGLTLGDSVSDT